MPMGYANQCGFTTTKCSQKICAHRSSLKTGNGGRKRPDCEGASGGTGAKPGLAPENGPKGSKKEEDRLKGESTTESPRNHKGKPCWSIYTVGYNDCTKKNAVVRFFLFQKETKLRH